MLIRKRNHSVKREEEKYSSNQKYNFNVKKIHPTSKLSTCRLMLFFTSVIVIIIFHKLIHTTKSQNDVNMISQEKIIKPNIQFVKDRNKQQEKERSIGHQISLENFEKQPSVHHENFFFKEVSKAPWDPSFSGGRGHLAFESQCTEEIRMTQCEESLPLDICLRMKLQHQNSTTKVSKYCNRILNPCKGRKRRGSVECTQDLIYRNSFSEEEVVLVENMLSLIDKAALMGMGTSDKGLGDGDATEVEPLDFWLTAGSMIGTLSHHGMIPWDDDVDIYVRREHSQAFIFNLESLGLSVQWVAAQGYSQRSGKIYNSSLPSISKKYKHSYPFVDFFLVDCSDGVSCIEFNSAEKFSAPVDFIFPLKRRPFGRLSLPFPRYVRRIVENRYPSGKFFKKTCSRGGYHHRYERFLLSRLRFANCSDLILPPPFVIDERDGVLKSLNYNYTSYDKEIQGKYWITDDPRSFDDFSTNTKPWPVDFPNITIEHLLNDGGKRLSSVMYDDGNEIRRSYADDLLQKVDYPSVTYSFPDKFYLPQQKKLVPYMLEERISFKRNKAGRNAEDINKEVLPTLDRVVISNEFGHNDTKLNKDQEDEGGRSILKVGNWNAERGLDWDIFPQFYPNADIIILNEMDWGMARSGNKDTTKNMAKAMQMNYAYGVEFLELTNGNEREINATRGLDNLIGYHGNVVMTKWPIVESKIVRLHPLYDLLFEEKTTGQAKGERRLGGRMALFTLIESQHFGTILAISMHSHSGSNPNLLKQDALLVCKEIEKYPSARSIIIGGDLANPIPKTFVSECGFAALDKTNSKKGNRLASTWKVVCKDGHAPSLSKYSLRGDFILMKQGQGYELNSNTTKTDTIYMYRRRNDDGRYECISDHALITLEVKVSKAAVV